MAMGDYLTRLQFGRHDDPIDQAAADWLEANTGNIGKDVARSLGDLIRQHINQKEINIKEPPCGDQRKT